MKGNVLIWYGWIPTNKGQLNFDFIELPDILKSGRPNSSFEKNKKLFENLDISYLSDSYGFRKYLKSSRKSKFEFPATANVEFKNNDTTIQGKLQIIYKDSCTLSTKFVCRKNGIVRFEGISYDIDSIENDLLCQIKTLFYVLVKTLVHGDAHHHQKIDVALPIMDDEFKPSSVSLSLLNYIKLTERNIKNTKSCESLYRSENLVFEMNGYLSYFKSFTLLFEEKPVKHDFEFAKNVVTSLRNTVEKRKNKAEFIGGLVNASIAFVGLIVAVNIFLNGFWPQYKNNMADFFVNENRLYYFIGSVTLILFTFLAYIRCKIHGYVYYSRYDLYEFIALMKNADFSDLNWNGKAIKCIPYIFFVAFGLVYVYLINWFMLFN